MRRPFFAAVAYRPASAYVESNMFMHIAAFEFFRGVNHNSSGFRLADRQPARSSHAFRGFFYGRVDSAYKAEDFKNRAYKKRATEVAVFQNVDFAVIYFEI